MLRIRSVYRNSTNVRVQGAQPRALAAALAAWAFAVAVADFDGVFARLPAAVDLALAAFATLFAAASYLWDADVRSRVDEAPGLFLAILALAGDALAAWLAFGGIGAAMHGAHALVAFFVVPLAFAAHLPAGAALVRTLAYVSACEVTWRDPGRDLSSW